MKTLRISNRRLLSCAAATFMAMCCWCLSSSPSELGSCETLRETSMSTHEALGEASTFERAGRKSRNFTIVTGFFNLGILKKGNEWGARDLTTYLEWMWPYRLIENGVVAYFDDTSLASRFAELRGHLPTKVVIFSRSELWAFTTVNRTRRVFLQPDYPKNSPKSTNPDYVAAMHAKYELMARVANGEDPFGSSYVAWMDLGIYRTLPRDATSSFMLNAPICLRDDAIMFSRIYAMSSSYTLQSVMRNGHDWVGGGFFIARRDLLVTFYEDYSRHVESYLEKNLSNHDQSVLLAMYLPTSFPRPSVPLQIIFPAAGLFGDPWFYMALQARRDALETKRRINSTLGRIVSCCYNIYS